MGGKEVVIFKGRLAVQQRVLPAYRTSFLELLAERCSGGVSLFAGQPLPQEHIAVAQQVPGMDWVQARNRHFGAPSQARYLCWQSGLLDWLKREQPDGLILEANPRYLSSWRAAAWMRRQGRPVLGWGLGAPPQSGLAGRLLAFWRRAFYRRLDGLIAYSQKGAAEYRACGMPPERVWVASNAAARQPSAPAPLRPEKFSGRPVVLFVGRLQQRKRLDVLFRACQGLPAEIQPEVWVVGDGPAREQFEQEAGRYFPETKFLGAKFGAELEEVFGKADMFVLPGTGGLAVQQAMSFGLPVIVAQGDGTQSDLVRPENGWLVPPGDAAALQQALAEGMRDPAGLRRKGAAGYRIVAEEINLERMVETFLRALGAVR